MEKAEDLNTPQKLQWLLLTMSRFCRLFTYTFFGAAVYVLSHFIFDEVDEDDIKMEFAACGLMTDYYYRTSDTDVADEPKIKEETARIFSDYEFVKSNPDAASFRNRIAEYKQIMLV